MKRVHTKIYMEWDGTHYVTVAEEGYDYDGEWELLKESSAEKQQRIQLQNLQYQAAQNYYNVDQPFQRDMAKQQMDQYMKQAAMQEQFQKQYMDMQQSQFSWEKQQAADALQRQQAWLDPIKATMTPYLSGDAFGPAAVNTAQDQAMQQIASGYGDAAGNVRAALLSRGGGGAMPMGGDFTRGISELESGMANQVATTRDQIRQSYLDRNLAAKFNAAGVLMGGGSQYGADFGALNSGTAQAAQGFGAGANTFAQQPIVSTPGVPAMLAPPKPQGFWSSLGAGLLGQAANVGMGFATGGLGNMFGNWFGKQSSSLGAGVSGGLPPNLAPPPIPF